MAVVALERTRHKNINQLGDDKQIQKDVEFCNNFRGV